MFESDDYSNGRCAIGGIYILVSQVTMQILVRHGRGMILPVLLGAHAARSQTVGGTKIIIAFVAISGSQRG